MREVLGGGIGGESLRGVVDELEMHAPFQKFGRCDVFRDGRDVVIALDGGGTVAAREQATMSGREGGVEEAEWSGLGVVKGGGGGGGGGEKDGEGLLDGRV